MFWTKQAIELQAAASQPLEFVPIPEVSADQIGETIREISRYRAECLPSYGAFVIRSAGFDVALSCINLFGELTGKSGHSTTKIEGLRSTLHPDPDTEKRINDMTAHVTVEGSTEVIVLVNSRYNFGQDDDGNQFARELFASGQYDGPQPAIAYREHLQSDDVLLFDSTELHAFRQTSDIQRVSHAFFYETI
jgi:hypothetical protein